MEPKIAMKTGKTEKEVAFLYDIFISSDWTERFADLIDDHLALPQKGEVLYMGAGTGGHVVALQARAEQLTFLGVDEREEFLRLARAKAEATRKRPRFRRERIDALSFKDESFDLVISESSLLPAQRVPRMVVEAVRVAKTGSLVAISLPTASSFGEFFSVFWEAVHNCDLEGHERDVEGLILELPTTSDVEEFAQRAGLEEVTSTVKVEEFDHVSAEEFLKSPLISEFLIEKWLKPIPESERERVLTEISRIIDEESHETGFSLSVKATIVLGRKSH